MANAEKLTYRQEPMYEAKYNAGDDGYRGDEMYDEDTSRAADAARLRKVYRKLDLRIIPAFWVLYFLCSAVRANVG